MNPIGYREFKNDLKETFHDLDLGSTIITSLIDFGVEDHGDAFYLTSECNGLFKSMHTNMGKMKMIAGILHSLDYYEDVGHLFPPFS